MNWQKTQSPWLKILAVFGADEPMSSVSAQKQSPWVETVSPRAHEFRHNPKKGPQKTPKFMGSLPHDRAHITCWLGSGCRGGCGRKVWVFHWIIIEVNFGHFFCWRGIFYTSDLPPFKNLHKKFLAHILNASISVLNIFSKVGCKIKWDRWSDQTKPACTTGDQYRCYC